ncbi:hypothetical protein LG634_35900 [Streptomyces bambusae]|uniref:hypothetical protein n=1 Tax=Streptomyces bambusae TaxID=1550616 RepID=UPI001CFF7376|nr:hypothetical protein [Streptomyces bambusae]MCB5170170.1 hypothetical protein [Streptomyces bambusae]
MIRNALGSLMGLIGATAAVWSPFRAWYDGRHGRDYRIEELFSGEGITLDHASLAGSLFTPFAIAAVLTVAAVFRRSRVLMACAGVLVLGFTVLWMVRQGQAAGSLSVGGDRQSLGPGVANAFGGGVLLLLAAVVMTGRGRRSRRALPPHGAAREPEPGPGGPYEDGAQGHAYPSGPSGRVRRGRRGPGADPDDAPARRGPAVRGGGR